MIHLFQGRRKLFSFPKKWANSIVRWISGICSPSGTIKVSNTMDPGEEASLKLDVDMDAVAAAVLERFEVRPVTNEERDRLKHLLRGMIDGLSILMGDGHLFVSAEWLEDTVKQLIEAAVSGCVTLDTVQTILANKSLAANLTVIPNANGNASVINVQDAASSPTVRTRITGGDIFLDKDSGSRQLLFRTVSGATVLARVQYSETSGNLILAAYDSGALKPNGVVLAIAPTDTLSTSSLVLATLGWVNDKFIRKVASGSGVLYSANGTVSLMAVGKTSGTVAAGDHTHSEYAPASHTHPEYEGGGSGSSIDLPSGDGVLVKSGSTLSVNSKLSSLASSLDSSGKVPLTQLTGNIAGHSGKCLVTIENDGTLGHSLNNAWFALESLANYLATGSTVGRFPPNRIMGTDANGEIATVISTNGSRNGNDKMLVLTHGHTTPEWANIKADDPYSPNSESVINLTPTLPGGDTSDSLTTWTANNANGVTVRVQTRTHWSGTTLFGFYRDMTYDCYGRLYSVSAETSYVINTPAVATWS